MREQDTEKWSESDRREVSQGDDCLDVLIHQHGDEHISTLAQLLSLTSSVERNLTHNIPHH